MTEVDMGPYSDDDIACFLAEAIAMQFKPDRGSWILALPNGREEEINLNKIDEESPHQVHLYYDLEDAQYTYRHTFIVQVFSTGGKRIVP